ncbi:MAG TPA: ATP-dependent Clp protease ATP-binding subunit ClpA, partial [Gammaproteobacteria bacterium]|nr:ATP-dependent Clp protease ATP-binding subunit ClpA [Gammaproteobacteria bacterium]
LPDKAIDIVDEVGASLQLLPEARRRKTVTAGDVEAIVAKVARIPPKQVSRSDRETMRNLERDLKLVIYGQDAAILTLANALKTNRSGLGNPGAPIRR